MNTFGGIVSATLNVPDAIPVSTFEMFSTESIETKIISPGMRSSVGFIVTTCFATLMVASNGIGEPL